MPMQFARARRWGPHHPRHGWLWPWRRMRDYGDHDVTESTDGPLQVSTLSEAKQRRFGFMRRHGGLVLLIAFDAGTLAVLSWALSFWSFGVFVFVVFYVLGLAQAGLYRSRFTLSVLNDLPVIASRFLIAAALAYLVFATLGNNDLLNTPVQAWVVAFVVLVLSRATSYAFIRYMRRNRLLGKPTLIVGCGRVGIALAHALLRERDSGLEPLGFVDSPPPEMTLERPLPLLGPTADLVPLIEAYDVSYVLVAFTHVPESELVGIIRSADRQAANIAVVPRLYELTSARGQTDVISDIPLTRLSRLAFRSPLWRVKRLLDIAISLFAIVVLSPLLLMLALVNRIVDGPKVIFRQERVGVDGRTFNLYKFRSLRPADSTESATKWNISNDDRVSWFGKILRKSSLDELPQLVNILRGDMSIVGPRPERPHFAEQFQAMYPYYDSRHRVPCGLTGWAQIHGLRGDTSIAGRARYDNFYIENWSLWLDFKIVLRTVFSLTRGAG